MEFASQVPFREERVLLHELNHRINNEFASAISVVSLAAAASGSDEVKLALTGVTELLHHYADVHRALEMPEHDARVDAAAYLRKLCLSISRSKLNHGKINLVLAACPLPMESDRCWRLGNAYPSPGWLLPPTPPKLPSPARRMAATPSQREAGHRDPEERPRCFLQTKGPAIRHARSRRRCGCAGS
jgi:Histidine kinase